MELNARIVGPLEAVHTELGTQQSIARRGHIVIGNAEHHED